jgi:hypothetical protein
MRNAYKILVGNPEVKRPFVMLKRGWENIVISMIVRCSVFCVVRRVLVSGEINLRLP